MRKLLPVAAALLLAGCVGGGANQVVVVEERTPAPARPAAPGEVVTAPDTPGVTVTSPVIDQPVISTTPSDPKSSGSWVVTQNTAQSYRTNPAVVALLGSAKQQMDGGSYRAAGSTLERAQRIAPREPEVYYQMARLRLKEGEWKQAEQLALKGVQVASGSNEMQRRLWLLIGDIREDAGDRIGAQRARIKARRL